MVYGQEESDTKSREERIYVRTVADGLFSILFEVKIKSIEFDAALEIPLRAEFES